MTASDSLFSRTVKTVSQGLIIALYLKAVSLVVYAHNISGVIAQQIVIAMIIVLRLRKRTTLPFMPDEILVSLPYFWAMSVVLQVASLPAQLIFPSMLVFVMAIFCADKHRAGFIGGLKSNSLLQAIAATVGFLLAMSLFLLFMLPAFDIQMYRNALLNIYFSMMGIPVSLCAFSWLFRQTEQVKPH